MDFRDTAQTAFESLASNKLRTALTIVGMVIGVAAVISLMAIGAGVQASVQAQFNSLGTNLVFVTPGTTSSGGVRIQAGTVQTLTYEDAQAIADPTNVPSASLVSPETTSPGQLIYQSINTNGVVYGVTDVYQQVHNYVVAQGSWISSQQSQGGQNVVVLGATVAQTLFPGGNSLGQSVRISAPSGRSADFQVIGVGQAIGGSGFNNPDTAVYVPLQASFESLNHQVTATGAQVVNQITAKAIDEQHVASLEQEITTLLLQRHNITDPSQADFSVTSQETQLQTREQVLGILTVFLGAVAGISLLVAGIGIMNIEIVSVVERTHEIGIRKAIGARRSDIMRQFLLESVLLSLTGGILGVLLALAIAKVFSGRQVNGQTLLLVITPQSILLVLGVSAAIGIIFGLYPAWRAASLRPIDALRAE
jgi:putative ABC transport system permease protein